MEQKAGAFVFPFQVIDMLESSERLHLNLMFGTSNNNPDLPASERNIRVLEPSIGRLGIAYEPAIYGS
jgi:hypothetical protein